MQAQYIKCSGFNIAFTERNPTAERTVFLFHGNSGSRRTWSDQFTSPLFDQYRLVAFDLLGHGDSSKAVHAESNYTPIETGKIMAEAVSKLVDDKPFVLAGFSYGTNVVAELVQYTKKPWGIALASSCVIGGECGVAQLELADSILFQEDNSKQEVIAFFQQKLYFHPEEIVQRFVEDYFSTDKQFRSALIKAAIAGNNSDEIAALRKLDIPVLTIFGAGDRQMNINYLDKANFPRWNDKIYKITGAGHYLHNDRPADFNTLLAEYLKDRFK